MSIIPPRLSKQEIWQVIEELRDEYKMLKDGPPVPILDFVEFTLGLQIDPIRGLRYKTDLDGFLSRNLKSLTIDFDLYM